MQPTPTPTHTVSPVTYSTDFLLAGILVVVAIVAFVVFLRMTGRRIQFSLRGVLIMTAFVAMLMWVRAQNEENSLLRAKIMRLESTRNLRTEQANIEQQRLRQRIEQLLPAGATATQATNP